MLIPKYHPSPETLANPTFANLFSDLVPLAMHEEIFASEAPRGSGVPKISYYQFTSALVCQYLDGKGTLSSHCMDLFDIKISDAALSGRKSSLGWEQLALIADKALQPITDPAKHTESFYKGLRLLALDMTKWNLQNTPDILANVTKAKSPKGNGLVAFAQINCEVLVELGAFNPLAVALSWDGRGELTLARDLFSAIPMDSLILGDRLYGSPWMIHELLPHLAKSNSHLLFRAKENLTVTKKEQLSDGSWIVEIDVEDPHTGQKYPSITLREIYANVVVEGEAEPSVIRLWTTLLDAVKYPALELVALYAKRWDHELFFREIKHELHGHNSLLKAQTVNAAAIELLSLMLAAAILARRRMVTADRAGEPMGKVSVAKVLEETMIICTLLEVGKGIISPEQAEQLVDKFLERLAKKAVIPKRGSRRCQRGVRKPIGSWAKISKPTSERLIVRYEIIQPKP